MIDTTPVASIVIATFNRKDDLRKAIASCLTQDIAVEVIVVDDGSTDGTCEMVCDEFPCVALIASGPGRGPSYNRNLGVERAGQDIVFKIDDDAVFLSPRTVRQTLEDFDHPRIATVAIPFHETSEDDALKQAASSDAGRFIVSRYIGCSMAVRRSAFLSVGGYNPDLFNMSEEADLSLKLLGRGFVTRLGRADPMRHTKSAKRDSRAILVRIRRNALIRCWCNVPLRFLVQSMVGQVVMFLTKWRRGVSWSVTLSGLGQGAIGIGRHLRRRHPVSVKAYHAWLELRRVEPVKLDQLEHVLPSLAPHVEQETKSVALSSGVIEVPR